MSGKMYAALLVTLIGLTACGSRNRQNVVGAVEGTAASAAGAVTEAVTGAVSADSIKTRFQGSDGVTKRLYWVDAVFYPQALRAKITVDGKVYQLEQYQTADGFGYHNAEVDLRGKGSEADLTYTDTKIRPLKLTEFVE
jgi:hypothetical protein